ncbi:hypothetical protein [Streptomyces malaysiensis]|uniref:Uncharacterized protein n=1 Tax=Streptomyces malaysiensis subsp. samsunensis TaxID=459658 RepID=A0A9X2RXD9_STRMQ|nr:hypothetical protein [Streptomyces samsunensis]MCQ8832215.1 hypothetical protein [Streptomyces samsunensis]
MTTLYVLDAPENAALPKVAVHDQAVTVGRIGPNFEIASDGSIVIDRRATGCRHAVWYSAVGGVRGGRIVQHDKEALRVEPA